MTSSSHVAVHLFQTTHLDHVLSIYPAAFPEQDLIGLLTSLAGAPESTCFVAFKGEQIVGHVAFCECGIVGGG